MQENERKNTVTAEELDKIWQAYKGKGELQYSKYQLYRMAMEQGVDLDSLRDQLALAWLLGNMQGDGTTEEEGEL